MVVDESSVLPKQSGTRRPHSYTTSSDHTYCYILETNNPEELHRRDTSLPKVKQPLAGIDCLTGLFLFVVIFGGALIVILILAFTSNPPEKGDDEIRVMHFSMYMGDMGDEEEEVKTPLSPRSHLVLRANGDKKCSLKKNVENTEKAISEIAKSKPAQQYNFILYGDNVREIGPLKSLEAQYTVKSLRPERQNNKDGFNQNYSKPGEAGAIETFRRKTQNRKDILVHYVPCNFTYSADDPDMEALAEMIESETGVSKKFSLVSNTKNSTELVDAFKAFNITEEVLKKNGRCVYWL